MVKDPVWLKPLMLLLGILGAVMFAVAAFVFGAVIILAWAFGRRITFRLRGQDYTVRWFFPRKERK